MRCAAAAAGIDAATSRQAALLRGLAVGDRRDFSEQDWRMLRRTGVGHLFSISGLHVGMVAIFAASLVSGLTWLFPSLLRRWPRRYWALGPALLAAWGYALLAGFEVPTRRTMAMIAAAGLALLLRRRVGLWHGWALALALILIADPLAVTSIGFWLSYLGVAWLLLAVQGRRRQGMLRTAVQAQWAVSIGLLPVGIGFFAQASWVSPLVNLLAIPWITLAVVPLLLLSLPLLALAPPLGAAMVALAEGLLRPLILALDRVSDWPPAAAWLPEPGPVALAGAVLAALLVLLPVAAACAGPAGAAAAARQQRPGARVRPACWMSARGTAVLVRTSGTPCCSTPVPAIPAVSISDRRWWCRPCRRWRCGAWMRWWSAMPTTIMPAARQRWPVTSGARCCLSRCPISSAGPAMSPNNGSGMASTSVAASAAALSADGNEVSCVLRVFSGHGSALLTSDAGKVADADAQPAPGTVAQPVLLLGHHGSRHSSTGEFLDAVQPRLAIARPVTQPLPASAAGCWRGWRRADRRVADAGYRRLHVTFGPDGPVATGRRQHRPRLCEPTGAGLR